MANLPQHRNITPLTLGISLRLRPRLEIPPGNKTGVTQLPMAALPEKPSAEFLHTAAKEAAPSAETLHQPNLNVNSVANYHSSVAEKLAFVSWGDGDMPPPPSVDNPPSVTLGEREYGIGSSVSSTLTARSSVHGFAEEHGRTYHRFKEGKYLLPNDAQEQDRLDLQHALFLLTTQGRMCLAPIGDNPRSVLDFGTGTGIWAIEFGTDLLVSLGRLASWQTQVLTCRGIIAQLFPGARVLGTDLSPIQPNYLPPNCRFEIKDAEDPWTFPTTFDFIHGRALASCFSDPFSVIRQAFTACAPGGYLELQDAAYPFQFASPSPDSSSALYRWAQLLCEGAARAGRPLTNGRSYKQWMEEAGFEDVVERWFYWPCGAWADGKYYKAVGAVFRENLLAGLEGISLKVLCVLGWDVDRIQSFLTEVREEIETDEALRAFLPIIFVHGRKPVSETRAAYVSGSVPVV